MFLQTITMAGLLCFSLLDSSDPKAEKQHIFPFHLYLQPSSAKADKKILSDYMGLAITRIIFWNLYIRILKSTHFLKLSYFRAQVFFFLMILLLSSKLYIFLIFFQLHLYIITFPNDNRKMVNQKFANVEKNTRYLILF